MPIAHSSAASEPTESIRGSLVGLRRLFQRKELAELWSAAFGGSSKLDYTELRLLDAVRSALSVDEGEATVGEIAVRLGVDPSRASRQVARAVKRGVLERRAVDSDGRKVVLRVTRRGEALQMRGSELTRARIALALEGWSAADRRLFAELFARFTGAMLTAPTMRARAHEQRGQAAASSDRSAPPGDRRRRARAGSYEARGARRATSARE
jgi:DNA-binding MarR family transcriptional regulator